MATSKSKVFRVTGLPVDKAAAEISITLTDMIREQLTEDGQQNLKVKVNWIPSCDESGTSSALLEFTGGSPTFLSELDSDPLQDWQMEMGDVDINFDRHFFGFTQLYPNDPGHAVTAE